MQKETSNITLPPICAIHSRDYIHV